jgi:FtsP/CotA-like multicopper oxidase with cupredoxin domain
MKRESSFRAGVCLASALAIALGARSARASIDGVIGPTFDLYASPGYIDTPDGNSLLVWGYAVEGQPMQYPGPTLIVQQGQTVTIHLRNELTVPTSLVLPGQRDVSASEGEPGALVREAPAEGGAVTYAFVASHAGTYLYHSGTRPGVQVEMGLLGALIVRPPTQGRAYEHADSAYDREHLLLLSEMDPVVHAEVELGRDDLLHVGERSAVLWFINGRNAPDTLSPSRRESPLEALIHPHQPYDALVRLHPGERVLMRVLNAGHDLHPLHTHGNHMRVIARGGRLLESAPGAGPDLAVADFTLQTVPGETYDALWTWTGEGLGWDIYGSAAAGGSDHECLDGDADGFDDGTREYCADHGKPFPVVLPEAQSLSFGDFYSGSPFLGALSTLPPGTGGFNLNGGLFFMWHSHNEKELANDDIFPGGMMTMAVVEPPTVAIPE